MIRNGVGSVRRTTVLDPSVNTVPDGAWALLQRDAFVAVPLLLCFVFIAYMTMRGVVPLLRDLLTEVREARKMAGEAIAELKTQVHTATTDMGVIRVDLHELKGAIRDHGDRLVAAETLLKQREGK